MAFWTDERTDLLGKLWNDGVSASQIAKQLGGVTRNAVIGKIHRMGLSNRPKPAVPGHAKAAVLKAARARRPLLVRGAVMEHAEPRPPRVAVEMRVEDSGLATMETLGAHMCRWPIGDPQLPSFTFCGRKTDRSYCEAHAARAYDRVSTAAKRKPSDLARSLRRYVA